MSDRREIKYLSPTSLAQFYKDRTEFYLQRIAPNRPPKLPQTQPMSIGSAFDAYVKSYLYYMLNGNYGPDYTHRITANGTGMEHTGPKFDLELLFATQVEPQNREWAWEHGKHVFEQYKKSGALADLMIELKNASSSPRFEFTVEGNIPHSRIVGGIPFLGKPDIYFYLNVAHIIYDFKVNGYCAAQPTSPAKGYLLCRDGWGPEIAPSSRGHLDMHKSCIPMVINGIKINVGDTFESINESWADQLTIYSWLMGEPVGSDIIIGIEQLCGKPRANGKTLIRVASHRGRVSSEYQFELLERAAKAWEIIQSGHIFDEMSRTDSDNRCLVLDDYHKAYKGDSPKDKWFQDITRQHKGW